MTNKKDTYGMKLLTELVRENLLDDLFELGLVNKNMSMKQIEEILEMEMKRNGLYEKLDETRENLEKQLSEKKKRCN